MVRDDCFSGLMQSSAIFAVWQLRAPHRQACVAGKRALNVRAGGKLPVRTPRQRGRTGRLILGAVWLGAERRVWTSGEPEQTFPVEIRSPPVDSKLSLAESA